MNLVLALSFFVGAQVQAPIHSGHAKGQIAIQYTITPTPPKSPNQSMPNSFRLWVSQVTVLPLRFE